MSNENAVTVKELEEKIQANIKKYIEDSEIYLEYLEGTGETYMQVHKEYTLGLMEILNQYSETPMHWNRESSLPKYLTEKEKIEKAKEEAEQKLGYCNGVAFACYEIMVDIIIDLFKKCNYSYKNSIEVTSKLREKISKLAYENSTKMEEGKK